jgi:hypothetical protein
MEQIRDLVRLPNGTIFFDPLNDRLGETADESPD